MIKKEQTKESAQVKVTFVLPSEEVEGPMAVVGDFNEWNPKATKLVKRANGTYSVSVKLDQGKPYAFRYVTKDGSWKNDESADGLVLNPFGTQNSVVLT